MTDRMRRTTSVVPKRPKLPEGRAEGEPERKGERLRRLVAAEQWYPALKLAASLTHLGEDKATIERAWQAMARPDFAREIGRDPAKLVEAGREVLRRRYGSSRRDEPMIIGRHKLLCGDLTQDAVHVLMGDERADVVYSDLPWGPGMLQAFATMNERGSAPNRPWPDFLRAFCDVVVEHRAPRAPVFVEMGWKWAPDLDRAMENVGLLRQRCWPITYGSKSAPRWNALTLYGADDIALEMPDPPHGEAVTRAVLAAVVKPGTVVLDPCTGLGMTARVTHALGGAFRGVELNPGRLERAAAWLRKRNP